MTSKPFIIYGLPRSRTYWLSQFLSYGQWAVSHEETRHMRSIEDLKSFLSQDYIGSSETAASPGWRLIQHYRPDCKALVVRRPVFDVVDSLMKIPLAEFIYKRPVLENGMSYLNRYLDQIEREHPNVLSVKFEDLHDRETCKRIFEFCLEQPFEQTWWEAWAPINVQINTVALLRYRHAFRAQIDRFKAECKHELRRLRKEGLINRSTK